MRDNMKKDIETKNDIELLVNSFYDKVKTNEILGYIFNDITQVNWEMHLPRMYAFWASMLLNENSFTGNPMIKHIDLSKQTNLGKKEFSEWLLLFNETVDELFEGEIANEAKIRAAHISKLMLYKIETIAKN